MKIKSFNVLPNLPDNLKSLEEFATNMLFTWRWESIALFMDMDEDLWNKSHRNPKWMIGAMPYSRLEALGRDPKFVARLAERKKDFDEYMHPKTTWYTRNAKPEDKDMCVAYFSMEYGIGEGLPIYSGGLGMLSGDHLKSSSDLGLPVIGVGLLYKKGYVKQQLNRDNWQVEEYPVNDWYNMPVEVVNDQNGNPLRVEVNLAGEIVNVGVWKVPVGRTSLYLLDTNLPENSKGARLITEQLYGGDRENRIRQEIVLGIGGPRALEAMGIHPSVYHVNEGHSAFLLFERIRNLMRTRGLSFDEAREIVWSSSVFTTHTPVIAGNEHFDFGLVRKYMESVAYDLGISFDNFLSIGKETPESGTFCMTVVAIRLCAFLNGVSKLHGDVSRNMWHKIWPGLPRYEVPILGLTNGVHTPSWISHEHHDLYKKYLNVGPEGLPDDCDWSRVDKIDDKEFWDVHMARKQKMVNIARAHLVAQHKRWGSDPTVIEEAGKVLNPNYLTIGFARRFATYKRATLFMRDLNRLMELVNDKDMPVQFVFAGKAHQADTQGKEFIKAVAQLSMDKRFQNRIIFVEDYNMNVARYLVQGVDVWMNNPIRPLEASGTSGMKAVINGVLNLSILDGWWEEGYSPEVGWAIGGTSPYNSEEERDYAESSAIYNIIRKYVAPLYYKRDKNDLPKGWIKMMKNCVKTLVPQFNTNRMLREYYEWFYVNAHRAFRKFEDRGRISNFSSWRKRLQDNWGKVKVVVDPLPDMEIRAGMKLPVRAMVWLGGLNPDEVEVQIHYGRTVGQIAFVEGKTVPMKLEAQAGDGYLYKGEIPCDNSGKCDFAVRVIGHNQDAHNALMPMFLRWNED